MLSFTRLIPFILVTVLLLARGRLFLSHGLTNVGYIIFNQSLRAAPFGQTLTGSALPFWVKAAGIAPFNQSAWRGAGFGYLALGRENEALDAWSRVDGMSEELLLWGQLAERQKQYADALTWYRRIILLSPESGDPWLAAGRVYQKQRNWAAALAAFQEAAQKDIFYRDAKSDAYFQQGVIYQWAPEYKNAELALENYNAALKNDRFSTLTVKADAFYKRGEVSGWLGYDPAQSMADYQRALTLYPGHTPARLRWGINLYWQEGDLTQAEQNIQQAIEAWRQQGNMANLAWAYRSLGDIYFDAGLLPEARSAYQTAVDIEPQNQHARDRLAVLNNEELNK